MATGLVTITYFAALVKPASSIVFSVFGIAFNIMNPRYISIGIILASVYGLIRYVLYGIIIGRTPNKARKLLLANKMDDDGYYEIQTDSKEGIDDIFRKLEYVFPSISKDDGGIKIANYIGSPFRNEKINFVFGVKFKPNRKSKLLEFCHDIDYTAPIWGKCYRFNNSYVQI